MFSFTKNKTIVDLYPYVRRICDLTTPNLSMDVADRSERRFNRTIPTLLSPWQRKKPNVDQSTVCLTSDLADRGVGLVLTEPFAAEQVVVGYWIASDDMPQPWFFLADVRRNQPLGGGFWTLGVEFTEFANTNHQNALAELVDVADKLLPPETWDLSSRVST